MNPLQILVELLSRPTRTCGIHGDDTTSGRCARCDAEAGIG